MDKEVDMDLEEEREDSNSMTGEIGNTTEETILVEENETPQIKESRPKQVAPTSNRPYPKCLLYKR